MKIKWNSIYYPYGEWVDERGNRVDITGNFKCKCDDIDLLCIMSNGHCRAGHGEPAMDAPVPSFVNAATLEAVCISGFVELIKTTHKAKLRQAFIDGALSCGVMESTAEIMADNDGY